MSSLVKKIEEDQYSLEIMIEASSSKEVGEKIKNEITESIGDKWKVPVIEEERVSINERFLSFIKRAEIEHRRYLTEKRKRLVLGLAALLSIISAFGVVGKKYIEEREQKIVATEKHKEREKAHERIEELEQDIQNQIKNIDAQIQEDKPFTILPNDMAIESSYEETDRLLRTVREAEFELRKLAESDK